MPADPNALRVPATALLFGEAGVRVAVLDDKDTISFRPVQLGADIGTDIEIKTGVTAADRLIDSPVETLVAGDTVRVVGDKPVAPATASAADTKVR